MSDVELLRAAFEAWTRGGVENLAALPAGDIEWPARGDLARSAAWS